MIHIEREIQKAVIQYIRLRHPGTLFTIAPNGFRLPIGVAKSLKAMGYSPGTPDIMVFEPRGAFHGLFIELKRPAIYGPSKVSAEQKAWQASLADRGYIARVCYGTEDACNTIEGYLK